MAKNTNKTSVVSFRVSAAARAALVRAARKQRKTLAGYVAKIVTEVQDESRR